MTRCRRCKKRNVITCPCGFCKECVNKYGHLKFFASGKQKMSIEDYNPNGKTPRTKLEITNGVK